MPASLFISSSEASSVKKVLVCICFFGILIGLFHAVNLVLFEKQHFGTAKNIAYEEPEKIDVFFVGASHIFYGINPMEIWNETGISGYNLTTHQQPLWASSLLLKHALRRQHPKLVVLDVIMATNFARPLLGTEQGTNMTHLALDPVPLSFEKVRGVLETDAITEKGEILFPVILSHSRLQQGLLTYDDFHFFSGDRSHPMKGYNFTENTLKYQRPESIPDSLHELPEGLEDVLTDFIEFCRKENLPLLLIKTPIVGSEEFYEQINYIGRIAAENDVDFLDFNHLFDELDLDFQTDFADTGHLNVNGARKVSLYLGNYIASAYNLPDHRGDSNYAGWDRAYKHYSALRELKNSTDILPHLEAASDPNFLTVILSGGLLDEPIQLPENIAEAFHAAGLSDAAPLQTGKGAYAAVIQGGKVISEQASPDGILTDSFMVREKAFSLRAVSRVPDGGSFMTALYIDNGGFFALEPGILAVTYDMDRMETVDAVRYAFDKELTVEHLH